MRAGVHGSIRIIVRSHRFSSRIYSYLSVYLSTYLSIYAPLVPHSRFSSATPLPLPFPAMRKWMMYDNIVEYQKIVRQRCIVRNVKRKLAERINERHERRPKRNLYR